jgi:hypothetical protein
LGRGERETRGEHRGRGERLPSGSRFVFPVPALLLPLVLLLVAPVPAAAQLDSTVTESRQFTFGVRVGGVYSTRLMADEIGFSILPDTTDLIGDRFRRDTIAVGVGIAPDLTLIAGMPLNEETTSQLAAGYSFSQLEVKHGDDAQDAGGMAIGHAVISAQKPIGGFLGRLGAGVLWLHGGDVTAVEEMRTLNPVLELAIGRRWPWRGMDLDVGLAGQVTQLTSSAIELRGGTAGLVYRLGAEVGLSRRIGR